LEIFLTLGLLRNENFDVLAMLPNAQDVQFLGYRSVAGCALHVTKLAGESPVITPIGGKM
jgi:hypothetical protein